MCGIFGAWHFNNEPINPSTVRQAVSIMRHRGPSDEGYLLADSRSGRWASCCGDETVPGLNLPRLAREPDPNFNLALGHRRLSILDLSIAGHGPMTYQDGALWITYNGEVYNYLELRAELKRHGHTFRTGTDTEVVLAAYAEWGPDCLSRLNGMFAFAVWDKRKRLLFCARDRLGIKPFHYYWDNKNFVFASEIKALLAHPIVPNRPNDAIIYDYLSLGSLDHTDHTFFEDIKRLPPSHYLLLDLEQGQLELKRWWDIQLNPAPNGHFSANDRDFVEQFRELLVDSVRLRLRSDVVVGTCLSGGLDSSSIVAIANQLLFDGSVPQKVVGDKQKTFSACFGDPAIDERPYIQEVVEQTGVESNQVFPQADGGLWADLPQLIWHQEEPFGSTSIYSQWNVMKLAQGRGVTVLLDGQGGDELLAGYHHYAGPYLAQTLYDRGPVSLLKSLQAVSAGTGRSKAFLLGLGVYNSVPEPIQKLMLNLGNTRFRTNPTVSSSTLLPAFEHGFSERRRTQSKHRGGHNLAQRLYQDMFVHSLPALLRYEDRNSMAFSLEARVPFLDYRLVEFCFSLPASHRIRDGWTKWILRQAMQGYLPEQVLWRRTKLGFATPERRWLREGAAWIARFFDNGELQSAAYLTPTTIHQLRNLSEDTAARIPGLWRLVNLEMWLRLFQKTGTPK